MSAPHGLQVLSASLDRVEGSAPAACSGSVAIDPERARLIATTLRSCGMPAMVLATCHRLEAYWWGHVAQRDEVSQVLRHHASAHDDLTTIHHETDAAYVHLMAVASGLRSLRRGEPEILGQVRNAWRTAQVEGCTNDDLDQHVQSAISAARHIRRTHGSWSSDSIGESTVSLITKELSSLALGTRSPRVLLVGAGAVGVSVATAVHDHAPERPGAARWMFDITNRTDERAIALAARCGGTMIPWDRWTTTLAAADVVVFSARSPQPLVTADHAREVAAMRGRATLWVDLASPPNIAPDANDERVVRRALADLAAEPHPEIDAHIEHSLSAELERFRTARSRREQWRATHESFASQAPIAS